MVSTPHPPHVGGEIFCEELSGIEKRIEVGGKLKRFGGTLVEFGGWNDDGA